MKQSIDLDRGTIYSKSDSRDLVITIGRGMEMAVLLSDYCVKNIQIEESWHGGRQVEIFIASSGPAEMIPLEQLPKGSCSATDLSIDELMKIVYQKLEQRSLS